MKTKIGMTVAALLFMALTQVNAVEVQLFEDPNPSDYCKADAGGNYPSEFVTSHGDGPNYGWGMGGGCIHRPIREIWAVMHNQQLMVWKRVTSSRYKRKTEVPANASHYYEVVYEVDNPFPNPDVNWTMDWFHYIKDGSMEDPSKIVVTYGKSKGTAYIELWNGSIVLEEVAPNVTAVAMRDQIRAAQTGPADAEGTVKIVLNKLKTGTPNWGPIQP